MQNFGFIFDLDGTLLNTTDIGKIIPEKIMEKYNIVLTRERRKELEILAESMLFEASTPFIVIKLIITLLKEVGLTFKQRIGALIYAGKLYKQEKTKLMLYEGTEALLNFFDNNSIRYCIITNSSRKSVKKNLRNVPWFLEKVRNRLFTKDDFKQIKPHPESFIKACRYLKIPPERTVVVGDYKDDIIFGKSKNAVTVGVLTGFYSKERFLETITPDFIINSVADIPNILDEINEKFNEHNY